MKFKSRKILVILMMMALTIGVMAPAAWATNTTSVLFQMQVGGNAAVDISSVTPTTGTTTYTYSSYYCQQNTYKYYDAKGQSLFAIIDAELIAYNNAHGTSYTRSNVNTVTFTSNDATTRDISMSDLSGYYYATTATDPGTAVAPIIATQYGTRGGTLSSTGCLRNFYGQPGPSDGFDDDTMGNWVKTLSTIVLHVN